MELIEVEYLEESSKAIFFNVTYNIKASYFRAEKQVIRRAILEKWNVSGFNYANNFIWADNKESHQFDDAVLQEMILEYEKNKNDIQ